NLTLSDATGAATIDSGSNPTTLTITNDDPVPADATLVVNTADDNDFGACTTAHCSLREAIKAANANADSNTINFNIDANSDQGCDSGTGICTIMPGANLPAVTHPVTIDGYTQPGASANDDPDSNDAVLQIELDGENVPGGIGLDI